MHTLKLIEYTPAAKQRNFDPRNSSVNFEPAHSTTHKRSSEYAANVLLAKQAKKSKYA